MGSSEQEDDKQFEPTQKKLADARKKGEIPKSNDLTNAAAYAGFILAAFALGHYLLSGLANELSGILANAPELAIDVFAGGGHTQIGGVFLSVVTWVTPWFAIPAIAALLAIVVQKSFVIAPTKLRPKLSKISMIANAKNKFGRQGLFEFLKSFLKLLIYSCALGFFLTQRTPEMAVTVNLNPSVVTVYLVQTARSFLVIILAVAALIGMADFFWQQAEHTRKNRMSRKEVTDEAKQMEGDPHVKQQRRQRGHEIAMNQMLADVPTADVIIVNPQHFAVALKWSREKGSAPVCVAKGVDEIAARIRESAAKYGVPIHRDPPTARALYSAVDLGEQIPSEQYRAVAAAIRFAEAMGKRNVRIRN